MLRRTVRIITAVLLLSAVTVQFCFADGVNTVHTEKALFTVENVIPESDTFANESADSYFNNEGNEKVSDQDDAVIANDENLSDLAVNAQSGHESVNNADAKDVVYEMVSAINAHDLDAFISLQCEANKMDYEGFFRGLDWEKDSDGLMCIKTASIHEIRELPVSAVTGFTSIDKYAETYDDLSAFYAGIDYTVDEESKYYFNGVNYRLIIAGKEDDQWKIVEVSDAPVESLENTDYAFNSSSEKAALNIINERLQGNIVKSEGNVLS